MESTQEFQGICPLCYKPVRVGEESRTLQGEGRQETYHAYCLYLSARRSSSDGKGPGSLGLSLLEQYQGLILPSIEKRAEWIAQNKYNWLATGQILRERREQFGLSVNVIAMRLGISVARLKRFESGAPVRDAKLLYHACISLMYVYEIGLQLSITREELARNQGELYNAIVLYDKLSYDMVQLSAANETGRGD